MESRDFRSPADNLVGSRSTRDRHCPVGTHAYPCPQLERDEWISLNGIWDFSIDADSSWASPSAVEWTGTIIVPFSPETQLSGVHETGLYSAVWYRREFTAPRLAPGDRLLLRFGAIDYYATVWVNGVKAGTHEGGYTPFAVDATEHLRPEGPQQVVVRAEDDPRDLAKPRGKQDWKLQPHSIWYPRTTGIWQTVWLEVVPASFIETLKWTSNVERWEIGLEAQIAGKFASGLKLHVRLHREGETLVEDTYSICDGELHRRIALPDHGIEDCRNELLWSPWSPTLIDVDIELRDRNGRVLDRVRSYTSIRSVSIEGDRFLLNGRTLDLRFVLDQGYWPESGLTAPDDAALKRDVMLAKQMGFNGVRKHQKVEDPRFLYWADRLGLLVWEEMPSAYRFSPKAVERLSAQWAEVLHRDSSHPCIVGWVPFNESWGVPDLPVSSVHRDYVRALYHLTKTLDPARPVIGNDGWESVATDIVGIHDYDNQPRRIARRYSRSEAEGRLLERERPGGRLLVLDSNVRTNQPIMLSEFGGIALANKCGAWGYSYSDSPLELMARYRELLHTVCALPALAGFCYTQFADTYQESNGLLYADRTPKAPLDLISQCTNGGWPEIELESVEGTRRPKLVEEQSAVAA